MHPLGVWTARIGNEAATGLFKISHERDQPLSRRPNYAQTIFFLLQALSANGDDDKRSHKDPCSKGASSNAPAVQAARIVREVTRQRKRNQPLRRQALDPFVCSI